MWLCASVVDLSCETAVAFARSCPRGVETHVAFARAVWAPVETGVAFAGAKWVYFVCFSVVEVLWVSTVAVEGRAVVIVVSCWPASVAAEVSLVSKSPCGCAMCAKKFALRDLVWARARKSSPCMPKMAEKRCFQARWANFFAEMPLDGPRRASLSIFLCMGVRGRG